MIKEVIRQIVSVNNDNLGYQIYTNKQVINLFISNRSQCCEDWGVITTEDTLDDFIGTELLGISSIDFDYKNHPLTLNKLDSFGIDVGCVFIDFETSKGKLQFVLYNDHNGYYGHYVTIKSNQLNLEKII